MKGRKIRETVKQHWSKGTKISSTQPVQGCIHWANCKENISNVTLSSIVQHILKSVVLPLLYSQCMIYGSLEFKVTMEMFIYKQEYLGHHIYCFMATMNAH